MKMKTLVQIGIFSSVLTSLLAFSGCDSSTSLDIGSVGDTMAYDKATLEASPGATVKLTLKNNGSNPAMQHDWILVKPGTETEVVTAGITAGAAAGYIPANDANVLAHTKLTKPGESDTITFKAPDQAGDYPYLCTYPGHYPLMKGVLKVQ
jgi:azurin